MDTEKLPPAEEPSRGPLVGADTTPAVRIASGETVVTPNIVTTDGEGVAENYVTAELAKARAGLQRTRLFGGLLALIFAAYFGYITATFCRSLQPQAAAEIASGIVSERVQDQAQDLSAQLHQQIPALIAGLPDRALTQMPIYRKSLEDRIIGDMTVACHDNSDELGKNLDAFLDLHKADIKDMMTAGQDKSNMEKIGDLLQDQLLTSLRAKPESGKPSVADQLGQSLTAFKEIETRTHRLAANKNLSPEDKKMRHAIAVVMATTDKEMGQLTKDFGGFNPVEAATKALSNVGNVTETPAAEVPAKGAPKTPTSAAPPSATIPGVPHNTAPAPGAAPAPAAPNAVANPAPRAPGAPAKAP